LVPAKAGTQLLALDSRHKRVYARLRRAMRGNGAEFCYTDAILLPLLVEQGNALVICRLGDRLQIGVDIREVVVRQDRLRVRRHGAVGGAHESGERLDRDGLRRELGTGDAALGLNAVTLPTAVLDIGRLAFLGRGGERAATAHGRA